MYYYNTVGVCLLASLPLLGVSKTIYSAMSNSIYSFVQPCNNIRYVNNIKKLRSMICVSVSSVIGRVH